MGPTGGDVLTITRVGGKVVAPTELGVFRWDDGRWHPQPALGLSSPDPTLPVRALISDGAQLNYPRASLIADHDDALWMITRSQREVALLWSDSLGQRWARVPLPPLEPRTSTQTAPVHTTRAAEPPRLAVGFGALFLVATHDIWRFGGDPATPTWVSIGREGLPSATDGLPPAIRNYLPRAPQRPFEIVTVLTDQLLVFIRSEPSDPWVLTSTMAVVDREILGAPRSDAVFIIAPNSIQRTDDQGELWFRFWPAGNPQIEAFALRADDQLDIGYALLVGGADGSIWASSDAGATWNQKRPSDPDGRAITGFTTMRRIVWASTLGQGVLRSTDGGDTWEPQNARLRAARPLDVAFTNDGYLLLASRAGLVQLSGEPESGNWTLINDRASSSVTVDPISNRIVSGSILGDVTTQGEDSEAVTVPSPFGARADLEFSPIELPEGTVPPRAVVAIAARDDGQRWLAWSRRHGAATSEDGGASWRTLKLSDALRSALLSTTVTQVIAEPNDTIYLVDENPHSDAPGLLWRSEDDGESWTTVHAFPRNRSAHVIVEPRPPNYPGVLFAANGDRFARSTDSGATWTTLEGPWTGARIVGLAMQEDRAALLLDTRRTLEVVVVDLLDSKNPRASRHAVVTPSQPIAPSEVARFELHGNRAVITTGARIWIGTLPEQRRGFGDGTALFATLVGALVAIAGAFVYVRGALAK